MGAGRPKNIEPSTANEQNLKTRDETTTTPRVTFLREATRPARMIVAPHPLQMLGAGISRDLVSPSYRGTATFTAHSVQGPLRHLAFGRVACRPRRGSVRGSFGLGLPDQGAELLDRLIGSGHEQAVMDL